MKRNTRRFLGGFSVVLLIMIIIIGNCLADGNTISIRSDLWPPYNFEPDNNPPGYAVEIVTEIFAKAGYKIDYQLEPYVRSVDDLKGGKIDGILGTGEVPDLLPIVIYPKQELGVIENVFFVLKSSTWRYSGPSSLKAQSLGVVSGYYYGTVQQYIDENRKDTHLVQEATGDGALDQNIKKLMAGRVTVVLEDRNTFLYRLNKLGFASQVVIAGAIEKANLYLIFSLQKPHSKEYAQILSDGIVEMRKSGRLKAILNKYGVTNWQ